MNIIRKYTFRTGVGFLIYFFIHLAHIQRLDQFFGFTRLDQVMMVYTVLVALCVWGAIDYVFCRFEKKQRNYSRSRDTLKAFIILSAVTFPMIVGASVFSESIIKPIMACPQEVEAMYKEIAQGQIFAWLIIAARIIRLNSEHVKQMEQDKALIQKELLQSQYQNLKNQINPHFLFNSFSVLQMLIETDPPKASEFLSKLSSMYRYILEHREEGMSSVEKEISVLQVYLYLLKTRHEDSLVVNVKIDPSAHQFFLPTLSLQMLVENAVKHNLFSKKEPLIIDLFVEDQFLVVRNTVKRRGSEVVSTKVGLENIRSQYHLQSDKPVMIIEDEQFFTVKIPVLTRLKLA